MKTKFLTDSQGSQLQQLDNLIVFPFPKKSWKRVQKKRRKNSERRKTSKMLRLFIRKRKVFETEDQNLQQSHSQSSKQNFESESDQFQDYQNSNDILYSGHNFNPEQLLQISRQNQIILASKIIGSNLQVLNCDQKISKSEEEPLPNFTNKILHTKFISKRAQLNQIKGQ